ncbi:hypothetical protein [Brevibacterium aurantiacum]|uniref:hypothetical protein n=1 Tax=Brevibacterium aurantiacum TaxID=273384 RepID=UPI00186969EF|nr:hypothetical protein [Brevibacterium aurantiacum]
MTAPASSSPRSRRHLLSAIGYGVGIWVIATGLLVTVGPALVPDAGSWSSVLLIVGFGVLALGIATLAYLIFRRRRTDSLTLRLLFSTVITATGLLLDAVVYGAAAGQYPVLSEQQQGPVAFFLVLAYGLLLLAPHLCRAQDAQRSSATT